MRCALTPASLRRSAKRSNAAFQLVKSVIPCSMCRVAMSDLLLRYGIDVQPHEGYILRSALSTTAHVLSVTPNAGVHARPREARPSRGTPCWGAPYSTSL